jgi:serine/threonine-protein kinase
LRNGKEAVAESLLACQLTNFKDPYDLDTLAAAYAEAGDFEQAIQFMTKALQMKIEADEREGFQKRLALYRSHQPYRDTESREVRAKH